MKEFVTQETLERIGAYLQKVREAAGMTQAEAAERAGFASGGYISLLENGHREVSKKTLFKLAQAYEHISLGDMVEAIAAIKRDEEVAEPRLADWLEKKPTTTVAERTEYSDSTLRLLDGAICFIEHDDSFQMPTVRSNTAGGKAMLVSIYQQQHPERCLLTEAELQRVIESE